MKINWTNRVFITLTSSSIVPPTIHAAAKYQSFEKKWHQPILGHQDFMLLGGFCNCVSYERVH